LIRRRAGRLALLPFLLLGGFVSAGLVFAGCDSDLPQGAIAQVGTNLVSEDEFNRLKAAYEAAGRAPKKDRQPEKYKSFERGLAEYLVTLEILRQEAPALKVTVTEAEVRAEMERMKKMFLGEEEFEGALKAHGLTLEQLTQSLREGLLIERMKAAVAGDMTVSEEEAQAYYEAHKSEYVEQESREVRHILISPFAKAMDGTVATSATQQEWDAAKVEAERARSEIQNGSNFVTVVEKYSDDEATSGSGGVLGAVTRGLMVPAFEVVVFSLQAGEISQPVKTQYGYQVIEVTDITPERQLAYDQVKENIKAALLEARQTEAWEQWLALAQTRLGVQYLADYKPNSGELAAGRAGLGATTTIGEPETDAEPAGSSDGE
jgi:foldase protein PrsA